MLHLRKNAAIAIAAQTILRAAMDLAAARLGRCPLAKRGHDCFKSAQKKRQTNDAGAGRLGLDIFA